MIPYNSTRSTRQALDALYADLEAGGLARSTVRLLHTQLHRAMADAVRWDLRHGWATMALEALEHPKVVAEPLGHASVRVTPDTYSHVTPGVQREAVTRWPAASSPRLVAACWQTSLPPLREQRRQAHDQQ